MHLGELSEAYQVMLEGVRTDPDDEILQEDLKKAERELEIAWLEQLYEVT
jgi:hypothetical protein